jgi:predicted nucleotidyltransferase
MGRGNGENSEAPLGHYEELAEDFSFQGFRSTKEADDVLRESGLDHLDIGLFVVGGSHAYGLSTPTSDRDYRGFYVSPIQQVLYVSPQMSEDNPLAERGWLNKPAQTEIDRTDPDLALYEMAKFAYLAGRANPNVLELLYAPLLAESDIGRAFRENRNLFLSQRVRQTYLGYAVSQLRKTQSIEERRPERRAKFARHLFRLLEQGEQILTTGELSIRVSDPEKIRAMGEWPIERVEKEFEVLDEKLKNMPSGLPLDADWDKINDLLVNLRLSALAARG